MQKPYYAELRTWFSENLRSRKINNQIEEAYNECHALAHALIMSDDLLKMYVDPDKRKMFTVHHQTHVAESATSEKLQIIASYPLFIDIPKTMYDMTHSKMGYIQIVQKYQVIQDLRIKLSKAFDEMTQWNYSLPEMENILPFEIKKFKKQKGYFFKEESSDFLTPSQVKTLTRFHTARNEFSVQRSLLETLMEDFTMKGLAVIETRVSMLS
jgi:hypothetical protein